MGTPIINQPQVAIMAVGAIKKKPAVIETIHGDMIGIRHMMFLSLSYDHRVVDGALGGSFLRKVAETILLLAFFLEISSEGILFFISLSKPSRSKQSDKTAIFLFSLVLKKV